MAKGAQTRSHILEEAMKMASSEGLSGLTIGLLAKVVGMSKSGLFAHFQSKDNLQLMVVRKTADDFTEKVVIPMTRKPRGLPRVEAYFENWVEYFSDSRTLPGGKILIACALELDEKDGPVRELAQSILKDLIMSLEKAVKIAVDEGHFHEDLDVAHFSFMLYSTFVGFHQYQKMLGDPSAEGKLRKGFEDLISAARPVH